MENGFQKNKNSNDESSSLIGTNTHLQPRVNILISVLLILLSLSIICSTCYYVLWQQEKAKLERKIQELEIAIRDERDKTRLLRDEIDRSKQVLAKEFIQNERDKEKLEDEKQKLKGEIQNLETAIRDERNESKSLHDEIDKSKQDLAEERIQNERDKVLLRNQIVYYCYEDDYPPYRYRTSRRNRTSSGRKRVIRRKGCVRTLR